MRLSSSILLAAILGIGLSGSEASAQVEEFEAAHADAVGELVGGLEELAGWCTRKKLYGARAGVWRSVLGFDDGHEQARRGLGYKRNRDGEWVAPRKPRVPRDFDKRALEEFPARHLKVALAFRDRVLRLLEEHESELEIGRARAVREQLLVLDPDDAVVRKGRGEVRVGERWVLGETSRAVERRGTFSPLARELLAAAPGPVTVAPSARERAFGLEWTACLSAGGVRVLGTCPREELERIMRVLLAQRSFVNQVLGLEADFPSRFTAYALTDADQGRRFIAAHPDADERIRRFMEKLVAGAIPGSHDVAAWCDSPEKRLDGLARLGLQYLLGDAFRIDGDHGWAFEAQSPISERGVRRSAPRKAPDALERQYLDESSPSPFPLPARPLCCPPYKDALAGDPCAQQRVFRDKSRHHVGDPQEDFAHHPLFAPSHSVSAE